MPKVKVAVIALLVALAFSACVSQEPRDLDITTISGSIPLTNVTVLIRQDADKEHSGKKFLAEIFPEQLVAILNDIKIKHGITVDASRYLEAAASESNIQFKVIDFGGSVVIHEYSWTDPQTVSPRATFALSVVVREDGSLPATLSIVKDDPDYAPGYVYNIDIPLRVSSADN